MPDTPTIPSMFDTIAGKYDLLNKVLSFGRESSWRRRTAERARAIEAGCVLDLAAGTGDQLIALLERAGCVRFAAGVDASKGMMKIARGKLRGRFEGRIALVIGDACGVPFANGSFDLVTMSFGMRNLADRRDELFSEMLRVLKPGGRALILELTPPEHPLTRIPALIWLRIGVPFIGGKLTGDTAPYRYLAGSIERFPKKAEFMEMLRRAGFVDVSETPMTFGAVRLFDAAKPPEPVHQ